VFFAYNATKTDILAALTAAQQWAGARCQESLGIGVQYTEGRGPFPAWLAELLLTSRFLTAFCLLVSGCATWAPGVGASWSVDPCRARSDPAVIAETVRRAAAGSEREPG
jgi:hypothetical protein